jgi:hypothetical protein
MQQKPNNTKKVLKQYAGFAFQMFAGLGLLLFAGYKVDGWQKYSLPLFTWILPLLYIVVILVKAINDTKHK